MKLSIKRVLILLVFVAVSIQPCTAAFIQGAGSASCTYFNHEAQPLGLGGQLFSWAQGYMSGRNVYANLGLKKPYVDLNAMSPDSQERFLANFCRTHPKGYYIQGIDPLWHELEKRTSALPKN